jgi:hypothetical protein
MDKDLGECLVQCSVCHRAEVALCEVGEEQCLDDDGSAAIEESLSLPVVQEYLGYAIQGDSLSPSFVALVLRNLLRRVDDLERRCER